MTKDNVLSFQRKQRFNYERININLINRTKYVRREIITGSDRKGQDLA